MRQRKENNKQAFSAIRLFWPLAGMVLLLLLFGWGVTSCQAQRPSAAVSSLAPKAAPPTGVELRERLQALASDAEAWKVVRRIDAVDAYHSFLLIYPKSEFAGKVFEQLKKREEDFWKEVQWALNADARIKDYLLMKYLDLFPDGIHREEARRLYERLPEKDRWYTLEFNDRRRAGLIFAPPGRELALDSLRLAGMADYLKAQPKGMLAEWITEKFVRTYISARYLPLLPGGRGRRIMITPPELARLQDGLERYEGLPPARRIIADAYLRGILLRTGTLELADDNSDSIIDGLEIGETLRLQREKVELPQLLPELETLEKDQNPYVTRPAKPEKLDHLVKTRPKDAVSPAVTPKPPVKDKEPDLDLEVLSRQGQSMLRRGRYNYDPFPVLKVDTPYIFRLEITPGLDSLTGTKGRRPGGEIPISNEMAVRIISVNPDAFRIQPISDSIQPVGDSLQALAPDSYRPIQANLSTMWYWSITPLLPGKHEVLIIIEIVTKGKNVQAPLRKTEEVARERVEVIAVHPVAPPHTEEEGPGGFRLSPYWLLLLLLPLALLLFFLLRRRGRRRQRPSILLGEGSDEDFIRALEEERIALQAMRLDLLPQLGRAEQAIARGETDKALDELLDFFRNRNEPIYGELLSLSASYRQYLRAFNLGLNPDGSIPNRINLALIHLLSYIRDTVEQD